MQSMLIFFKMLATGISILFGSSNFTVQQCNFDQISQEEIAELRDFEKQFTYPFSETEEFIIEHGRNGDYSSFFKQFGKPYYYLVRCKKNKTITKTVDNKKITVRHKKGEIAAAVCCILRTIPTRTGKICKAWYICDLKVDKNYQGEHLPTFIAASIGAQRFWQCPRGFGICMNPPSGEPQAARIAKKHSGLPGIKTDTLNLYVLTAEQAQNHYSDLQKLLTQHSRIQNNQDLVFSSTSGLKDYNIFDQQGNSRFWQLYHAQAAPTCTRQKQIWQPDATYMISALDATPLDHSLRALFGAPPSTAQIVSYGMEQVDFNFLTSNQI